MKINSKRKTSYKPKLSTLSPALAASLVGSWTLIFSIFVQAQNTWRFAPEPGVSLARRVWITSSVLLAQGQNILVALLLGSLVYLGWRRVSLRIATVGLAILVNLIVLLDQISYRLYFQHFQVEMGDGGVPPFQLLTDSLVAEADWVFYLDLLLLGILFWLIGLFLKKINGPKLPKVAPIAAALAIWCGISFCAQPFFKNSLIPAHPLVSVIQSGLFDSSSLASLKSSACTGTQKRSDFYSLWKGLPTPTTKQAALAHQKLLELGQARPNVILIVLESVGAVSLLRDDGTFDAELTPTFDRLAKQGVLFPKVYDLFPGTVRSHVPLHTGGSSITSGSAFQEFSMPYHGPTLTSELSRLGYETALFSAQYMSFENMKGFYERLPFDFKFTPDPSAKGSQKLPELNSWGVSEEAVSKEIIQWVSSRRASAQGKKPFFLELISLATHHPYSAPNTSSGESAYERYRKALHYTDSVLGSLFESLKVSGDLANTLVVVMGDHGQAFGDRHLHNFLHGNFLYEENIRNFILLSAPGVPAAQDLRVAFIGDVAPTLIELAAGKANAIGSPKMLGQSLLSPQYSERIRFFHKNITPERWGLVDGNWKYIGARLSFNHPELYDLSTDPFERINLADQYPERIAEYECRTRQWYLDTQREYLTHLEGLSHLAYTDKDFSFTKTGGPRGLHIGARVGESEFETRDHIEASILPIAQVDWAPINEEKICELKWISPQNKVYKKTTVLPYEVNRAELAYPGKLPLEPGPWRVELRSEAGGSPQLEAHFVVTHH